jgi:hypothetical protein
MGNLASRYVDASNAPVDKTPAARWAREKREAEATLRANLSDFPAVANTPSAVVANKKRSGDRHKDQDARRAYQRDLMRKRRAEKRAADGKASATKQVTNG